MAGLCATVGTFAGIFLFFAAITAFVETALLLIAKARALKEGKTPQTERSGFDAEGWAKLVAALKDLLLSLKDLPAWFALFLAGLALVWTAVAAPGLCAAS